MVDAIVDELIDLLARWPRPVLWRALTNVPTLAEQYQCVANGELRERLEAYAGGDASTPCSAASSVPARPVGQRTLHRADQRIVSWFDPAYPSALRTIPDPPLILYFKGVLPAPARTVAIVGARRCTRSGSEFSRMLGRNLAEQQIAVVSGLALGIDGQAHEGALAGGGYTVAVMGCGLDRVYPARHRRMATRILDSGGCLLSEYPPGSPPLPHQFPERNRIISGLSQAVVVVEASLKSGSLITARCALEQGRDVFAVPGPPSSEVSRGCHRLLKEGAALVESAQDVCIELGLEWQAQPAQAQSLSHRLSEEQQHILDLLRREPLTLEELVVETQWPGPAVLQCLNHLRLHCIVSQVSGRYIAASRN